MKIKTSSIDTNNYFTYILSNGLKIIAISDLKADKAGCALSVSVGSYDEPKEIQGLAHFLEHMLFMGTKEYPKENEYMDFLSQHNGSSNAYTSNENTVYYFDIGLNYFYEALKIFSSFFKNPLFLKESVDREISAVHSEFLNGKCNDSWRIFRMIQLCCKEYLPESQFNVGNNKTLRIDKINEIVKKFWEEKYSSEKMCVVLYSNEEEEEKLKKYCELFEGISQRGDSKRNINDKGGEDDKGNINDKRGKDEASKGFKGLNGDYGINDKGKDDKNLHDYIKDLNEDSSLKYPRSTNVSLFKDNVPLEDLTLSKTIFKKDFLNRIIHVEPIKEQRTLIISVVVPSEFKFIGINPYSYIEHFFTMEDEKGLVGRIKDKGLGFYADFDLNSNSKYSLLQISIGLTSKGEKDLNLLLKIVEDYFSNFEFINEEYEKIKDLKELQFFYKEMDDPIDCVESMAEIMQYVPIENVFDYSYILHKYDQKVLEEIVSCIGDRSKWVIFYLKKDLDFDSEDELYGIKYKVN